MSSHELLGQDLTPIPPPVPGEPTREVPSNPGDHGEWVPTVPPAVATGPLLDYYEGDDEAFPVVRALSLVPATAIGFARVARTLYLHRKEWPLLDATSRALARPSMELVAIRTSALNECFY